MRYSVKRPCAPKTATHRKGKGKQHQGQDSRERGPKGERSHQPQQQKKKQNQTGKERWRKKRLRLDERASCHHRCLRPTEMVDEKYCQRKNSVPRQKRHKKPRQFGPRFGTNFLLGKPSTPLMPTEACTRSHDLPSWQHRERDRHRLGWSES